MLGPSILIHLVTAIACIPAAIAHSAQLQVEVVDAFGGRVPDGVRASIYKEDGYSAEATGGSRLTFKNIPYGSYRLEVICPGFRILSRRLIVSEPTETVRVGLKLGKVGDPEPSDLSLYGQVRPCHSSISVWIKAVGVFTDETFETKLTKDCAFRIPGLAGGSYAVMLIEGEVVKGIKLTTVTQHSRVVNFINGLEH